MAVRWPTRAEILEAADELGVDPDQPTLGEAFRCYFVGPFVAACAVLMVVAWAASRWWARG